MRVERRYGDDMADEHESRPAFLRPVTSGLPNPDSAPALAPAEERKVDERLREIVEAREAAAVNGRDYLIH